MDTCELAHIGYQLFGNRWKTPLAKAIGVQRETIHRWLAGKHRIGPAEAYTIRDLHKQGKLHYREARYNAKGQHITIGEATLIHGDSRSLSHYIKQPVDVILTDPVWPNALPSLAGSDDPFKLLSETLAHVPYLLKPTGRIIIQLRCDSDPRILNAVPAGYPFIRTAWLPYAVPSREGRKLISGDVAYIYGQMPPVRAGNRVLPGQIHPDHCPPAKPSKLRHALTHPCPRNLEHVEWLVEKFTAPNEIILDPFMGSGTTAVAALQRGRQCIGVEIERKYWLEAQKRVGYFVMDEVY
jgi:hypothetical protein